MCSNTHNLHLSVSFMGFVSLLMGSFVSKFWRYKKVLTHLLTLMLKFTDTIYRSVVCMLHNFLFWYSCRTIAHRSLKVLIIKNSYRSLKMDSIGMSKKNLGIRPYIAYIFQLSTPDGCTLKRTSLFHCWVKTCKIPCVALMYVTYTICFNWLCSEGRSPPPPYFWHV